MKHSHKKIKVGIVGCGAIGSRIAASVVADLKQFCELSGVYDTVEGRADQLARQLKKKVFKKSLTDLIKSCDLMVEAVNAKDTRPLIRQALRAKRDVLAMSAGKLLDSQDLFMLASRNRCSLLIPSGAIAGIDTVKAASLVGIHTLTLTTRKPPSGFTENAYVKSSGIDLSKIQGETVLFSGRVDEAVKHFPQNINVAATLALASQARDKLTIRIIASPEYTKNTHEIEITGEFGRMVSRTENVVCPDNPKTSYLAVLSGIRMLKDFCSGVRFGT